MDIIDHKNLTPFKMISYISNQETNNLNESNYLDYLSFDLRKHREGMVETFAIESYSSLYIGNILAKISPYTEVIHADDKRRPIQDIIKKQGKKPKAVFITSMSPNFPSAVATTILLNFGKIPVVLGGIHVSVSPHDVDLFIKKWVPFPELVAQVIGAGDSTVLVEIISNINKGRLKSQYSGSRSIEDGHWKMLDNVRYLKNMKLESLKAIPFIGGFLSKMRIIPINPFLGCPYSCNFCSISAMPKNQRKFTIRSTEDFVDELEYYQANGSFDSRFFFFLPDNLLFGTKYLERILDEIIRRKIKVNFATQISIDVASNTKILKKLRQAGATHFFIGFESLDMRNLEYIGKHILKDIRKNGMLLKDYYSKQIKIIQNHGISIHGAFIFGLPYDFYHSFKNHTGIDISNFCKQQYIGLQPCSLTDLPGSKNFAESQHSGNWLYGKEGTMKYLLSLCLTDLTESNRKPPKSLFYSPLIVAVTAYEAVINCSSLKQTIINGTYMFYKAFIHPTNRGRESFKERLIDASFGFISQMIVSLYKVHGEKVVFSNRENKGSFERLYKFEKSSEIKKRYKNYVKKFI